MQMSMARLSPMSFPSDLRKVLLSCSEISEGALEWICQSPLSVDRLPSFIVSIGTEVKIKKLREADRQQNTHCHILQHEVTYLRCHRTQVKKLNLFEHIPDLQNALEDRRNAT